MKKLLLGFSLASVVAAPLTYSLVATAGTENYSNHAKAENFKSINKDTFLTNDESTIHLRGVNWRGGGMLENITGGDIRPVYSKHIPLNKLGELKVLRNQEHKYTVIENGIAVEKTGVADILQNDVYSIKLNGNYQTTFTTEELKELFNNILSNVVIGRSMLRCRAIIVNFQNEKGARSVAGNMVNDTVTVTVNTNDSKEKIMDRIYYVTMHELMHLEAEDGSHEGSLLADARVNKNGHDDKQASMEIYGKLTRRENMGSLAKSLHELPFQSPSINNVYLGNIANAGYKTLSGFFESEITHLYTETQEAIVEDLLSLYIGRNHSNQYNKQITGLLGSIGYRISNNVSLLNIKDVTHTDPVIKNNGGTPKTYSVPKTRGGVNNRLLTTLFDALEFPLTTGTEHFSGALAFQETDRMKIGFYSKEEVKLNNDITVTINGKAYTTRLKQYKTNAYMRISPFSEENLSYSVYYNQILIPETIKETAITSLQYDYVSNASDTNKTIAQNALTSMIGTVNPTVNFS